jgi:hypothetical protein
LLGLLMAAATSLPLVRFGPDRRFLLSGWAIGIAVVLVTGWVAFVAFLVGIGGMAGPYPDPPADRLFGRSLWESYAQATGLAVVAMLSLQAFLRLVDGRPARLARVLLPPIAAVASSGTIVVLTVVARDLHLR